jgi:hypothetical protein
VKFLQTWSDICFCLLLSITMTQRNCHPQAYAIENIFPKLASEQKGITEGDHPENPKCIQDNNFV